MLLVWYIVEGGILITLAAYIFSITFSIMDNAMTQSLNMMNAIDTGDAEKIQTEFKKTDSFMRSSAYTSLNFLEKFFFLSKPDLEDDQADKISEVLDQIKDVKAKLNEENGNEELEKELDELLKYLGSLN